MSLTCNPCETGRLCRWTALLLLSKGADEAGALPLLQQIEEAALQLYKRPYLARGVPERMLILLHCLLERACPPGGYTLPPCLHR
jgi:hypothetical protein